MLFSSTAKLGKNSVNAFMSIRDVLEGLFFGSQIPFDGVNVDCPDYFKAGKEVEKCKAKILELPPV